MFLYNVFRFPELPLVFFSVRKMFPTSAFTRTYRYSTIYTAHCKLQRFPEFQAISNIYHLSGGISILWSVWIYCAVIVLIGYRKESVPVYSRVRELLCSWLGIVRVFFRIGLQMHLNLVWCMVSRYGIRVSESQRHTSPKNSQGTQVPGYCNFLYAFEAMVRILYFVSAGYYRE